MITDTITARKLAELECYNGTLLGKMVTLDFGITGRIIKITNNCYINSSSHIINFIVETEFPKCRISGMSQHNIKQIFSN